MATPISAERVLAIHFQLVKVFAQLGDPIAPPGPRDENLVHSAAHRPSISLGGREKYPTVVAKAASLFHSLVTSHPFHNGNKRTALVVLATNLAENHRRLTAGDDELFDFVTSVARGQVLKDEPADTDHFVGLIGRWIEEKSVHFHDSMKTMRVTDFLDCARRAGAMIKKRDGGLCVIGTNKKSVQISGKTRTITGMVARVYATKLGLTGGNSGVRYGDFQAGLAPEQAYLQSLLSVLRRLAHA